jgi:hypothetical protein
LLSSGCSGTLPWERVGGSDPQLHVETTKAVHKGSRPLSETARTTSLARQAMHSYETNTRQTTVEREQKEKWQCGRFGPPPPHYASSPHFVPFHSPTKKTSPSLAPPLPRPEGLTTKYCGGPRAPWGVLGDVWSPSVFDFFFLFLKDRGLGTLAGDLSHHWGWRRGGVGVK